MIKVVQLIDFKPSAFKLAFLMVCETKTFNKPFSFLRTACEKACQISLELREKYYSHKANKMLIMKKSEKLSHCSQVKD